MKSKDSPLYRRLVAARAKGMAFDFDPFSEYEGREPLRQGQPLRTTAHDQSEAAVVRNFQAATPTRSNPVANPNDLTAMKEAVLSYLKENVTADPDVLKAVEQILAGGQAPAMDALQRRGARIATDFVTVRMEQRRSKMFPHANRLHSSDTWRS